MSIESLSLLQYNLSTPTLYHIDIFSRSTLAPLCSPGEHKEMGNIGLYVLCNPSYGSGPTCLPKEDIIAKSEAPSRPKYGTCRNPPRHRRTVGTRYQNWMFIQTQANGWRFKVPRVLHLAVNLLSISSSFFRVLVPSEKCECHLFGPLEKLYILSAMQNSLTMRDMN